MTKWLEHCEKIQDHSAFINWMQQQHGDLHSPSQNLICPPIPSALTPKMVLMPSKKQVIFDILARDYGALDFQDVLADFIAQVNSPGASGTALWHCTHNTHIPFSGVPVYHNIKFGKSGELKEFEIVDTVHVWLEQKDVKGQIIPACFDTVLVNGKGLNGT
jgi:hypothetical protein